METKHMELSGESRVWNFKEQENKKELKEKFQRAKQNIMKKEKKSNALLTSKAEFSSVPFRFLKLSLSTTCFKESVIFLKPSFLYSSAFVYIFTTW